MRLRERDTIYLKNDEEIDRMAAAGRVVSRVLQEMADAVQPGITTYELDALAARITNDMGARASFLGFEGFPASICASVNHEVIHGIPNRIPLKEGDIIGLDYGACLDGFHADSAVSVPVGAVSESARRLLKVTDESLWVAINMVRPGITMGDIGHAVQRHCERAGFSVVREMVGHGIGRELHENSGVMDVKNYGRPGTGLKLRKGMTFCIEPMINAGRPEVNTLPDKWTIVTRDKSLSAHFEHTVAVTSDGVRVLTLRPGQPGYSANGA